MGDIGSGGNDGFGSGLGNYKGVMLCARPNENVGPIIPRPFISRVDPKEQIGLNPVRSIRTNAPKKNFGSSLVLRRHRMWLEEFKDKIRQKKEFELMADINQQQNMSKVRERAAEQRDKIRGYKQEYNQLDEAAAENNEVKPQSNTKQEAVEIKADVVSNKSPQVHKSQEAIPSVRIVQPKLTESNLKEFEKQTEIQNLEKQAKELQQKLSNHEAPRSILKDSSKKKPKWAYTEKQLQEDEEQEVEELLKFTENLDFEKYVDDLEVKNTISLLKKRIEEIKKEEDWKKKIVEQWNNDKASQNKDTKSQNVQDDVRSQVSETQSVASEKSQKSIKSLKDQLQQREQDKQEWDKSSTAELKGASLEERIAKHVADEILRTHTTLGKVHSNASIRKLLEREANKYIQETGTARK